MRVQLREALINKLAALPETGMGYQLVDVILRNGREICAVVAFNAEVVELPEEWANLKTADIVNVRLAKQKRHR